MRCAITSGTARTSRDVGALATLAQEWASIGIDLVQLREPLLPAGLLYEAAREMLAAIAAQGAATKLLINSRADVAVAAGAHGVHLTSRPGELTAQQVRELYVAAGLAGPNVGVSCHTLEEVTRAKEQGSDFVLFGPVFEKRVRGQLVHEGVGLDLLREVCIAADALPVLALGGITSGNAPQCFAAGASGIAGIRLFGG